MEETILNKLKEEHQELQMLLLKVERCKDQHKKYTYYQELKDALIPHMEGEEQTLYAHLKNDVPREEAHEVADLADYEHREVKDMLEMLDQMIFNSKEWNELFGDLIENLRLHFEEEETDLFAEAREDFSREELVDFVSEFEEAKEHSAHSPH